MTPDGAALRAAARTLDGEAAELQAARTTVRDAVLGTTWDCRAGAEQRVVLGVLHATAITGHDELRAGATTLRRLADAVDELEQDMASAGSFAQHDLQTGLRHAGSDPERADEAAALRSQLAGLPPAGDPHWARVAGAPSVAIAESSESGQDAPLGPPAREGVVSVDVAGLRGLAGVLGAQGGVAAACREAAATATALSLHRLDAFGLPGSRVGAVLADATSPAGATGAAAGGWAVAASSARALADLVDLADDGDVRTALDDPRAAIALELSVLATHDPAAAAALLDSLSPADGQWVLEHVSADAVEGVDGVEGDGASDVVGGVLSAADALGSLTGAVQQFNAAAQRTTAAREAADARAALARANALDPAVVGSTEFYRQVDEAQDRLDDADRLAREADELDARGRNLPLKLGGAISLVGIGYEIASGEKEPVQAVVSGGASFGASVLAGMGTGAVVGTLIPVPGVGTAVGAGVGTVVGIGFGVFTSEFVDTLFEDGVDVGAAFDAGIDAVGDTVGAVVSAPGALVRGIGGLFGG